MGSASTIKPQRRITLRVPGDLAEDLERLAAANYRNLSAEIREALRLHVVAADSATQKGISMNEQLNNCIDCGAEVVTTDGRCSDCLRCVNAAIWAAQGAWQDAGLVPIPDHVKAEVCKGDTEDAILGWFVVGYADGRAALVANAVLNDDGSVTIDDYGEAEADAKGDPPLSVRETGR